MKTSKITFALILLTLATTYLNAQHTNSGATLTIQSGLNIYAQNDFVNQSGGTIDNDGTIHLTGNWTNNAGNSVFTGSGTVELTGSNQTIGGSDITAFNNLTLAGSGVKTLSVDADVNGTLALGSLQLNTQGNTLYVNSTSTGAITRSSGYVASSAGGALARMTASTNGYLFPVAASGNYRPVQIAPTSSSAGRFEVRMANGSATSEGYNLGTTDGLIGGLNSNYFHLIESTSGIGTANVTIYFNSSSDGAFTNIGHWSSQWNDVGAVTYAAGSPLSSLTVANYSNFSPFILGASTAAIPAFSEWGLIILSLLTLTLVTLFIGQKQMSFAGSSSQVKFSEIITHAPFDRDGYFKILKAVLPAVIVAFVLIHLFIGTNGTLDFSGTIISTAIIAYIIQLYQLIKASK